MPTPRKPRLHGQAQRTVRATLDRLGGELRRSRTARRLTQRQLAERAGLSQSTISDIELGHGGSLSLDTWQRVAIALGHHLRIALGRDPLELPADAGHLDIQELILRLSPRGMTMRTFELNSRSRDSALSTDVGLVATAARRLVLIECINTIGDLGAAARSSDRKRREMEDLAVSMGGDPPWAIHTCWVLRDIPRNRALVARYAAIFAARFPGSSAGWVRAITQGDPPPPAPGLIWADVANGRLFARRIPDPLSRATGDPRAPRRRPAAARTATGPGSATSAEESTRARAALSAAAPITTAPPAEAAAPTDAASTSERGA